MSWKCFLPWSFEALNPRCWWDSLYFWTRFWRHFLINSSWNKCIVLESWRMTSHSSTSSESRLPIRAHCPLTIKEFLTALSGFIWFLCWRFKRTKISKPVMRFIFQDVVSNEWSKMMCFVDYLNKIWKNDLLLYAIC